MPTLTIDGKTVSVDAGATVLDAARAAGVDIPTLCHRGGCNNATSCLVCVVRIDGADRLVPSCGTVARDHMAVESDTDDVRDARRTALELLFSDHLGECLSPCTRVCPFGLDIPGITRMLRADDADAAAHEVFAKLPFPAILGRVCPAPCETACRRNQLDEALAIHHLERFAADGHSVRPQPAPDTGKRVAVVGSGPAGLAAAVTARMAGHAVTVCDKADRAGGLLRHKYDATELPAEVVDAEIARMEAIGIAFELGAEVAPDALSADSDTTIVTIRDTGLKVERATGATDRDGMFAAGDAVRDLDCPMRAGASGVLAAGSANRFLAGGAVAAPLKPFSSLIGKLEHEELAEYARAEGCAALTHAVVSDDTLTPEQIVTESARCLHCDCRANDQCALRQHGDACDADQKRFKSGRRAFETHTDHPHVIYEPGKCIACGICVAIAREETEAFGLAFIGRGFDVRVGVPFGEPLAKALEKAAQKCIEGCPTSALAARD